MRFQCKRKSAAPSTTPIGEAAYAEHGLRLVPIK
jgi:hypothetical protein